MKNSLKSIICATLAFASCMVVAQAQSRSAYFLDSYTYGYQMNPALAPERNGEVSFPGLGNLNVGMAGNISPTSLLYNRGGKTVTFLHPEVSVEEAMSNIKTNNRLGANVREGILNIGFKGLGGYNHISISAVANTQLKLPRALFAFVKEGVSNNTYDIGRVNAYANAYAEVSLNHSHDLSKVLPGLRIGASLKFLVGIGNIDINMERADLVLGEDQWHAVTNGTANVAIKDFRYETDWNNDVDPAREYVSGMDLDDFSAPNGYGVAIDLGAHWQMNNDWAFGFALTDFGFINWHENYVASTNGDRIFNTDDYTLDSGDFDSSWDKMSNDLTALYQLQDNGKNSRSQMLHATMTASAEFSLPTYRKLSFGLINTTQIAGVFSNTEFRLGANFQPSKAFGLAANYGIGTFGSSFGWMINIAPKGFNFYLGMDSTLGKLDKNGIPLTSNAQFSMGINFPF